MTSPSSSTPTPGDDTILERAGGEPEIITGDILIDAGLEDLTSLDLADLDGHIEAAESLQRTLQGRLANLGD